MMPLVSDPSNTGSEKFSKVLPDFSAPGEFWDGPLMAGDEPGHFYDQIRSKGAGRRYLRQKAGVNSTRTLKISNRPRSIARVQIQVWKSLSEA